MVDLRARRGRRAPLLVQRHRVHRQRPRDGAWWATWSARRPTSSPRGETHELPADLVLIAIGFTGVERGLVDQLDVAVGERGAIASTGFATTAEGVFACGDARRGQSLIVTAIAEGRQCAAAVERYLTAA